MFPVASWDVCPFTLVMMELKCAIVVSRLVIRMELKVRNCCSVCSMNDGQFALL